MEYEIGPCTEKIIGDRAYKIILSNPSSKDKEYIKICIQKKEDYYQAECYTQKQVFHRNMSAAETEKFCADQFENSFLQMNAWSEENEYQIKLTKKKKVLFSKKSIRKETAPGENTQHNRTKKYLLAEGSIIPPLVDMGVFTKDGKIVSSMHDKYRQINRFLEIVDDSLKTYRYDASRPLKVIDFGCGKSYLTFVLYYYLTQVKGYRVNMTGLDLKADVIEKCNASAKKYGYDSLSFQVGDIGCYEDDVPADMVITLHACDTATDYALYHAIRWKAAMIFSVPCCQHELNAQCSADSLSIIERYGIVKERTMALMTDAIRSNLLECCGYRTNLMEFVDFENTPKNLLIRASRQGAEFARMSVNAKKTSAKKYYTEVKELMDTFHVEPTLYRLLDEKGYLEKFK